MARDVLFELQRSYSPGRLGFGGQKLHLDTRILQIRNGLRPTTQRNSASRTSPASTA